MLTLELLQISPRHFIELQGELHLCEKDLTKVLNILVKKGFIEGTNVDITDLPEMGNQFVKVHLSKEKNGISFLNPLYVSRFDYPSGKVTFYYITLKGLQY
ncbi:MAG: hypothetical protein PHH61_00065 [Candidatus Nanoarchaeia archaeon]|nr:hypothetical protein [Candidatus Nanoarchaeia archaeon]